MCFLNTGEDKSLKPDPSNPSKSQTYGRMKNPRCIRENCKYFGGFPISWNRQRMDEHEQMHIEENNKFQKQERLG